MFPPKHKQFVRFTAAAAFVALTALSIPARADQLIERLGPVGPNEPIITTVGTKHIIAFYLPSGDQCAVHMVIGDTTDPSAATAARIRLTLQRSQTVHIDNAENKSLNLRCGSNAETLSVVDEDELVAFGLTIQRSEPFMRASGF